MRPRVYPPRNKQREESIADGVGPAATVQEAGARKKQQDQPRAPALGSGRPCTWSVQGSWWKVLASWALGIWVVRPRVGAQTTPHLLPCPILWGPELRAAALAHVPGQVSPLPAGNPQSCHWALWPVPVVGREDAEAAVTWLGGSGGHPDQVESIPDVVLVSPLVQKARAWFGQVVPWF